MIQKLRDYLSKLNISKSKVFVIVCLVIGVMFVSFFTPLYNVREITVEGNSAVEADTIIRASGITLGENIFAADVSAAKKRVAKVAYVDTVKVRRSLPSKIRISVTESRECAYINFIGNYVGIDENGKILDVKQQMGDVNKPVVYGISLNNFEIGTYIDVDDARSKEVLFEMLGQIKTSGIEGNIQYMDINDFDNITLTLRSKVSVKLGDTTGIKYKIAYLKSVLDELGNVTGGIIDITDTENVTYKAN
ncbi:MAG: FtsQ-type POTRA domain-containing protein [Clostridia bacterium]|nr:FtsQ-type POTRA domain-containing protein [Clostridia bacterium]